MKKRRVILTIECLTNISINVLMRKDLILHCLNNYRGYCEILQVQANVIKKSRSEG